MFADVIVDISHKNIDRPFCYRIPEDLKDLIQIGDTVRIPFGKGNSERCGYVVGISDFPSDEISEDRIKEILGPAEKSVSAEENLIALAAFIKERYGSTMITALKTVLPVKKEIRKKENKMIVAKVPVLTIEQGIIEAERKKQRAKVRLLRELLSSETISYTLVTGKLNVSAPTVKSLEKDGFLTVEIDQTSALPFGFRNSKEERPVLSDEQKYIVEEIGKERVAGIAGQYFIYGITGSGKTEVYMQLIEECLNDGKSAILLIPEIALTYQNLQRFYKRFGKKVAVMHSKLSDGEKYEQFRKAKEGEVSIMIGPRSALFTPFMNLGMIIIDEEHESSYKSETTPKYHAREVALKLGEIAHASVVMGSATPSLESYYRIKNGELREFRLSKRLTGGTLPDVHIVDMKEELSSGNRSVFSRKLKTLMEDRLEKGEQTMLFLNRRGYCGSILCRECGEIIKCPHCDISLSEHRGGVLICHYCGYSTEMVKTCPKCGSSKIGGFRAGTEQVEDQIHKMFPQAVVLRMDADTTKKSEDYENILSKFAAGEADILIGTQMIVKGHDFKGVTLMGILLADMSLSANDYRAGERTFQLLTQAAGRAGRGDTPGETVIQTYQPDHYAITFVADQDYEGFYEEEIAYREFMEYPPAGHMLCVQFFGPDWTRLSRLSIGMTKEVKEKLECFESFKVKQIGPGKAALGKKQDIYRQVVYYKNASLEPLIAIKDYMEKRMTEISVIKEQIQFDMDPINTF
ncbi:MAG: primosomal protein N' [Lachnospiraceae bacterium]|nr:primosomal protein N' [Lachnospiraceae bacterium]